jgi:hypothetical protein
MSSAVDVIELFAGSGEAFLVSFYLAARRQTEASPSLSIKRFTSLYAAA